MLIEYSIPRETAHLEWRIVEKRLYRLHQYRFPHMDGLGTDLLGAILYDGARAEWVVCFPRYVFLSSHIERYCMS